MQIRLHKNARTTPAIRAQIAASNTPGRLSRRPDDRIFLAYSNDNDGGRLSSQREARKAPAMAQLTVHAGSSQDMGLRFVDAFERVQAGQDVDERDVIFLSLDVMVTPKRLELLRHLADSGPTAYNHPGCDT